MDYFALLQENESLKQLNCVGSNLSLSEAHELVFFQMLE